MSDSASKQPSQAPTATDKLSPLRILCLGDSLTEGYSQYGTQFYPYSKWMKEVLGEKWPDREIEVITDGISGDLLTLPGGFKRRMERHFPSTPPITHTIILGGTNDLAYNRPVQTLYAVFETLVFTPLSNASKVLIMTIPGCHVRAKVLDQKREELNDLSTFDLRGKMPYHNMESNKRAEIWDDGLHFTEAGYKEMGIMVGEKMIEFIEELRPGREVSLTGKGTMGIE
ncbi:predicted protein [Sclerotinia sclerotiorum 1980 UF-70]|uniref:SGNH hydrolase-type esterase domain-containing protein n=1 Tax=Sclerotinia sclerotiorum (strain ATCC 18683 / 1980 / Ss-1) TaxID=665079 RepID=A7E7J9_SCLS1|nr:predicted protein [Sclerotinia sclerotiorum 1980 UF-70]EDN96351.1 predicted protein [Sclerotinia sclerotiorum 1980 UF-70]